MKTKIILLITLLTGISRSSLGDVTFNFAGGIFYDAAGTTEMADGKLLMLIASTSDSVFSAPTPTAFVSGDDVIVSQFGMNSSTTGTAGAMTKDIIFTISSPLATNQLLLLRWFPTLASNATAPGANTPYGEYRDSTYKIPSDGTFNLDFLTLLGGGSLSEATGQASFSVPSAIPEPSAYAMFGGLAVLGLAGWRRRFRMAA